jgi:hypothetical protein
MKAPVSILLVSLVVAAAPALGSNATSCTTCHPQVDEVVSHYRDDVHASVGLSCHDCHGGNPGLDVADDPIAAMDEGFAENPYRGAPDRSRIPELCGSCHSDPTYMRRFKPDARIDQVSEYWTSQHGTLLRAGDPHVATCIDCHGVHGIRRPTDPKSRVYPTQVAETCRECHGDAQRMQGYTLDDGSPLPIDQYELWRRSVHAAALFERENLSAPTCNDCHGNHGARPPGLDSVSFVCGQCHGREASLFRNSAKKAGFEEHNDFLGNAGTCSNCHSSQVVADVTHVDKFTECDTCHGNHAVTRPTVVLLGHLPDTPCAFCHESGPSPPGDGPELEEVRRNFEAKRDALLEQGAQRGLSGDRLFDWLVDRALELDAHTDPGTGNTPVPRAHFSKLWEKFRLGRTHFTYRDPRTGELQEKRLTQCTTCHEPDPDLAAEPLGWVTCKEFRERMLELTVLIAEAERTLLAAQRGGVEVRGAYTDLDAAINAEIQLSALVHTFSASADGEFMKSYTEGVDHASKALASGREGLGEIEYRRRGLAVSLVIILMVLVGLGLKIRDLSRRRGAESGS